MRAPGGIRRQGVGQKGGPITRHGVGDDQDTVVWALIGEVLYGEADEMVAIASDETALLLRRPVQLLRIDKFPGPDVVGAGRIHAPRP